MGRKITYQGKEYSFIELSEETGVGVGLLKSRVHRNGWTIEEAVAGEKVIKHTVSSAKREKKKRKVDPKLFATCNYRCNAK